MSRGRDTVPGEGQAGRAKRRADFGAPVGDFFERQPPHLAAIANALRALIREAAPDAAETLKWGMPAYSLDGKLLCMVSAHKAHVNLILQGPAGAYADPRGVLLGDGKMGRHLRLASLDDLPVADVRAWLRQAVDSVRSGT